MRKSTLKLMTKHDIIEISFRNLTEHEDVVAVVVIMLIENEL